MVRGLCAAILIGVVVVLVNGCASKSVVIPPEKVVAYSVELEFKLVRVEPAAPDQPAEEAMPSEAPIEDGDPDEAMPLIEPVEEPSDDGEPAPEPTQPEAEPEAEPEIVPEPMPEPFRPAPNETLVYAVQQTLTVGSKIDIKRVEIVKYMDVISDVLVEVEGNRMFSIEGKTKQIPGKDDFDISVLVTFKDEKLKLNFSCETSAIVSAMENSRQVIATVDDLKLILICKKIQKIEYEK